MQQIQLKLAPVQLNYSPDGKSILYTTTSKFLGALTYERVGEESRELTVDRPCEFDDCTPSLGSKWPPLRGESELSALLLVPVVVVADIEVLWVAAKSCLWSGDGSFERM